ncbi:MAG: methyltransferase domain-containing protein [Pseudomonadota bacterium]
MSSIGDGIKAGRSNWNFADQTAKNFDQHIGRSVPFYNQGHQIICDLSDFFISNNSIAYELGCATGELSLKLAQHNSHKQASFIGIDIEEDMIHLANEKNLQLQKLLGKSQCDFIKDDILQFEYQSANLIIAYYTVQFIRPAQRQQLIDLIYQTLNWGGALLLFEKVRANDARFQDITTSLYNDYKIAQGYSAEEIFSKTRSLKGILEPFSTQANLDLLKRAGFVDVTTVFKYICFEGFLAIK